MIDETAGPSEAAPMSPSARRLGGFGCAGALVALGGGAIGATAVFDGARVLEQVAGSPTSPVFFIANIASAVIFGALGAIAIGIGLGAVRRARNTERSSPRLFERSGAGLPLLVFALALAAGQLSLTYAVEGGLALAHVLAATMPPIAIIGAIAVRQRGATPRHVIGGLAWGSVFATTFAFIAEMFFLAVITLVLYLGMRSTVDGQAVIDLIGGLLRDISRSPETFDPEAIDPNTVNALTALVLRPSFVLATFALFGMLGPGAEELAKVAGVALLRPRDRSRAFLIGAACGAGFGAVEALLLGAAGLGPTWAASMLVRVFSTLMHALLSGVAGVGWYYLAVERRWLAGVRNIAAAILGHAAWNSLVLAAVLGGIASLQLEGTLAMVASTISIAAPLGLVLLIAIFLRTLRVTSSNLGADGLGPGVVDAPLSSAEHAILTPPSTSSTPSEDR